MNALERREKLVELIARRDVLYRQMSGLRARASKLEAKIIAIDEQIVTVDHTPTF